MSKFNTGRLITFNGKTLNIKDWAEELGMSANTVGKRLRRGLPLEEVFDPARRPTPKGIPKTKGNFKGRPKGAKDRRKRKPGTGLWRNQPSA